ncbi:hypothetical protein N864_05800 [Intrasporangium chromatireducens Q5-1]|uniref:Uncharacterized protein n=1 Tax=Intrasporangium chromatireducens Q5-1 TaxID=584657 RepID=W9GJ26_9MICO|nr:hypothetical protein [Intrasporangium chromatireducens]EWT04823.1 hypothetical protein N864_05800 [Intrasporangium chromatireducens Q5-1]
MSRVTYSRLSPAARETIRSWWPVAGVRPPTIAGYVRHWFPDGQWGGDECGCTDDRCIGYHHDELDECGCLPVLLDEYLESAPSDPLSPVS